MIPRSTKQKMSSISVSCEGNTARSLNSKEQVYMANLVGMLRADVCWEILARVMLRWFACLVGEVCMWKALKLFKPTLANPTLII